MKLKFIILLLLCFSTTTILIAQGLVIKGLIVNEKNEPIAGANILEVGKGVNGTSADKDGLFKLKLRGNTNILSISFIGYITNLVNITNQTGVITIKLEPNQKLLDEVVVVGYGKQKRITNTGAVSSIKSVEISDIPIAQVQNTLAGRLPGFFSQQQSGKPGEESAANFFIRGVNSLNGDTHPLVVVDDIETDYIMVQKMNALEIESITILKDASTTAIYGIKGANGVLVITTNRGNIGVPRINVTAEQGIDKVIRFPTFLDSYSTALLRNEATVNDSYGLSTPLALTFTQDDLQKFKDGSDPYGHPNVNWVKTLLNNSSTESRYNVDVNGGNSKVKYYTSLGYYGQNGIVKHFAATNPADDVNSNYFYNRFTFRSNLDITPNKTLKLRFDLSGQFETTNHPAGVLEPLGLLREIDAYRYLAPYSMPVTNPNGTYGYATQAAGNATLAINPIDRMANGGYDKNFYDNFNIVVGGDQKLNFITNGLSAKVNISYSCNIKEYRNVTRNVTTLPSYLYNSVTNSYTVRTSGQYTMPVYTTATGNGEFDYTTNALAMLNYDRTFGANHITGLAMINQISNIIGGAVPLNSRGITLRLGYDFKKKYLFEFDIARNGNDVFRADQAYGLFPAVSAGWNLSEEKLFHKLFPIFDLFKIRGSYGLVGSDFGYTAPVYNSIQYSTGIGTVYGIGASNGGSISGANEGSLVNPFATWEKERKTDIGLDVNMLNGKIVISADYFYNYRYDQLIAQGDVPLLMGQALPKKNNGITENKGFDGIITYKSNIGKVNFSVNANGSLAKNKIIYISEAPNYPYQAKTGTQLGLTLGYHCLGFYQQADFNANGSVKDAIAKPLWSVIQPGDLKYADLNHDGIINNADMTYLSKPNLPTTTVGLGFTLDYKGFSLRALLQGAFDYGIQITGEGSGDAFNSNLRPWDMDRWTPATALTATYPRIGLNTNINNISWQTISDFWMVNANYVRLKSVEIGYQLSDNWLKKAHIRNARIYATGYNLLTLSKMNKYQQDPEVASGQGDAYPVTANINLGLQLGF